MARIPVSKPAGSKRFAVPSPSEVVQFFERAAKAATPNVGAGGSTSAGGGTAALLATLNASRQRQRQRQRRSQRMRRMRRMRRLGRRTDSMRARMNGDM